MIRKLAIAAPLFLATAAVVWTGLNLPPPLWILKYGPMPGCEPTGEVFSVEGIEFVVIGPGIARIGSSWIADEGVYDCTMGDLLGRVAHPLWLPWGEAAMTPDEMPVMWQEFSQGFALARTEVTNAQYEEFDPDHERDELSPGDRDPVVNVSWIEAEAYCGWLTDRSGYEVHLPSESEWEAACRAGTTTEFCFGSNERRLGEYAWYARNAGGRAHEVATRKPNSWGFYDLHGNVGEWVEDMYRPSHVRAPLDASACTSSNSPARQGFRVSRGGGWDLGPFYCRSSIRNRAGAGARWYVLGFRAAMDVAED